MKIYPPESSRQLKTVRLDCDLAIAGGGMAGTCCAITAARAGLKVVLVQDRPVLGGNASSEVRLWVLGATAHMGNNNRWAREGGVIDEILIESLANRDTAVEVDAPRFLSSESGHERREGAFVRGLAVARGERPVGEHDDALSGPRPGVQPEYRLVGRAADD